MEIDVRQRNQRSIKRRERAQRMQAERESVSAGTPLNGGGLVVVGGAAAAAIGSSSSSSLSDDVASTVVVGMDASDGDSAEEDELPLVKVAVGVSAALATPPPSSLSGSSIRRHKKATTASVGESNKTTTSANTVTSTVPAMKEEVSVDWLKMEPRLGSEEVATIERMEVDENGMMGAGNGDGGEEESPLLEEDVIDGFSILAFKSYEDLEYAIKIANKRNEKRLSAISELTSTIAIAKISGSNGTSLADEGATNNNGELATLEGSGGGVGGTVVPPATGNHNHNGTATDDIVDPMVDASGRARAAEAEDRLRLTSPAPPPLKIDTGQCRTADRDRERDWSGSSSSNNNHNNKMSHNHVVTLINNNTNSSSSSGGGGANIAAGSNNANSGDTGSGSMHSNSKSGGINRPNHNHHLHHPLQPITGNLVNNKISNSNHNSMAQDPATSDDSGRASDRLISSSSSSVAPRDADSSRDRLSDASSRCSSGKGYICDSEGDDDKASDGSSSVGVFPAVVTTASSSSSSNNSHGITTTTTTLASSLPGASAAGNSSSSPAVPRKSDFPTTGLPPLNNGPLGGLGGSASPVPLSGTALPAPSPAPAALPPPSLPYPPVTTPLSVANGGTTSTHSNSNSVAPPRPLSNSSGTFPLLPAPPPPNSTNSSNSSPSSSHTTTTAAAASAANGSTSSSIPSSDSKAKPMGAPSVNGSATASPLKSGVPTVMGPADAPFKGGPAINGYGPGSPSNGHLPGSGAAQPPLQHQPPSSRLSALHSPAGHYVGGPGMHPHSHLPLHHPLHPHTLPPVGLAQPPTAAAPTATAPIIHPPPSLDSAAAATGRTNSPAVATSASHSAAAPPLINGNGLNAVPPMLGAPPGPLGMLSSAANGVLIGTSTGPPPPPIPMMPYGHRGGLVPPPVSSLYSNFPLYSPYAGLHNPYLPPMGPGGPMPPMSMVPSSVAAAPPPSASPASPSSRHMSNSFSINKLTSTTPPSTTTTTSASMSANGSGATGGLSKGSGRIGDLKSSASAGLRPGSPASSSGSSHNNNNNNSTSNHMVPDHMHHLQHYGQPPTHSSHPAASSLMHQSAVQRAAAHSPRGHSPNRERDSYSSNVSSLSRSSVPPYGAGGNGGGGGGGSGAAGPSPSLPGSNSILTAGTPPAIGIPPASSAASSSLAYPKSTWSSPLPSTATTPTTTPRPTPPPGATSLDPMAIATFPATPLFAAPLPPPTSSSSSASGGPSTAIQTTSTGPPPPPTAHPFSAEVLFQTNQADLLRRELDNRFLDRSGAAGLAPGAPFMRQELHHHQHQHQHQHTHLHQQIMPPAPTGGAPSLFGGPQHSSLFKDMPKLGESPFYRSALGGMGSYPGYASSLLHPGLSGSTPFMPPSHMGPFAPKQPMATPQAVESKPKQGKTGLWNAMHVRIAWEIYHHQAKQHPDKVPGLMSGSTGSSLSSLGPGGGGGGGGGALSLSGGASVAGSGGTVNPKPTTDPLLRPPSHMFPPGSGLARPASHDFAASYAAAAAAGRPSPFEQSQLPPGFLGGPPSHLTSPFGRYASPFGASPFGGLPPFPRDMAIGTPLSVHDAWRSTIPRTVGAFPPTSMASGGGGPPPGWPLKPDPSLDAAAAAAARREAEEQQREREQREREQRERERQRREREERERERQKEREKEEKLRKEQERERERERERREKERRDSERREMERERLLQQQRDSAKQQQQQQQQQQHQQQQQQVQRDRSPLRNGGMSDPNDIRIKDEPRKEDPTEMLMRAGDRYHHHAIHPYMTAGRQFGPPPHMGRPMMPPSLGPPPMSHFAPPPPHGHPGWPMLDPYRDPFAAYNPLRYNPIMEAIRADEERAKAAMNAYAHAHSAHLRAKEPSPIPPPNSGPSPHHRSPLGGMVGPPQVNGKMMPGGGPSSQQQQQQQSSQPMTNGLGMEGKKDDPMR